MELNYKGYKLVGKPDEMVDFLMLVGMMAVPLVPEPKQEPEPKTKKKDVDWAKAKALRNAGWSYDKIGDELKVSGVTVASHLKQMEEKKKE